MAFKRTLLTAENAVSDEEKNADRATQTTSAASNIPEMGFMDDKSFQHHREALSRQLGHGHRRLMAFRSRKAADTGYFGRRTREVDPRSATPFTGMSNIIARTV